mgnify:CR=1 FL=1
MPKIIHFRDDCIGCHACVDCSPDSWEMSDEDGKSNLKRSTQKKDTFVADISEVEVASNIEAAKDCPMHIIRVLDDDGNEIWD